MDKEGTWFIFIKNYTADVKSSLCKILMILNTKAALFMSNFPCQDGQWNSEYWKERILGFEVHISSVGEIFRTYYSSTIIVDDNNEKIVRIARIEKYIYPLFMGEWWIILVGLRHVFVDGKMCQIRYRSDLGEVNELDRN